MKNIQYKKKIELQIKIQHNNVAKYITKHYEGNMQMKGAGRRA